MGLQALVAGWKTDAGGEAWFELAFGQFYADLYAHRDGDEAETLLGTLEPILPTEGPVLDLACGGGRLLRALRKRRLAFGLDLSAPLLRLARSSEPELRLIRADMRSLPLAPGSLAAVLSLFTSFGYFADPVEDREAVMQVAQRLRPGGIYVLDFFNARHVIEGLVPRSRQQIAGRDVESVRSYDPETQILRKVVRVGDASGNSWEYEERVRAYVPAQLDELFGGAQLEVIRRYGSYDGATFDESASHRYVLVGRKGNP